MEKQNKALRDTIGRVQEEVKVHHESMKQLQADFNKNNEASDRRADQMHDSLQSTKRDLDRVSKVEPPKPGSPARVEEKPGIVFGGFSGCVLAEKSSQWLRSVLERYQIEVPELSSRTRRPKALGSPLRLAWGHVEGVAQVDKYCSRSSGPVARVAPAPWITIDQSAEERERTRAISQATRCCRSAAESL